jgi:RNA polymerase primary sigma factor
MLVDTLPRISPAAPRRAARDHYYTEIDDTPLLSHAEETDLAYRVQEGDAEARDHLARANLRLVVNIARHYAGRGMDLDDVIAEGNLGLLRAIESFDPAMNTRFSTYACYWVKQSIRRALQNGAKTIRLPAYTIDLLNKWRRADAALREELRRTPATEEVARRLNLPSKKLKIVERALQLGTKMSQSTAGEDGIAPLDTVADGASPAPEAEVMRSDELRQVFALLGQLDDRSRNVLRLRYGLDGSTPQTLQAIGIALGLTRERVRQIELQALAGLRELMGAA